MRGMLVEAYLHHRIAEHLAGLEQIVVAFPKPVRDKIAEPPGKEIMEWLGARGVHDTKQVGRLVRERSYTLYSEIFSSIDKGTLASVLGRARANVSSLPALARKVSSDAFGGRRALNEQMLLHALSLDRQPNMADKAFYNDGLRLTYQHNGKLPTLGPYNSQAVAKSVYIGMAASQKYTLHRQLLENLKDAEMIRCARNLFPAKIADDFAFHCTFEMFSKGKAYGGLVKNTEGVYRFNDNPCEDLRVIAMGAEFLLAEYGAFHSGMKVMIPDQSSFDFLGKRQDRNRSFLAMLALDGDYVSSSKDNSIITASTWHEYFKLHDARRRTEIFNAFRRLYGNMGYARATDHHDFGINIILDMDGTIRARTAEYEDGINELDWDSPQQCAKVGRFFDPLLRARGTTQKDAYFRKLEFEPSMQEIIEQCNKEAESDRLVRQSASALLGGKLQAEVETELMHHIRHVRPTYESLAGMHDRIGMLLPIVEADPAEHLKTLGIANAESHEEVNAAYRASVKRNRAHPDAYASNAGKLNAARMLSSLQAARDELYRMLDMKKGCSKASVYLGDALKMLKKG